MTKQSIHNKEYIALRDKSENYAKATALREKHFNAKAGIPWDDYTKAAEYMEAWTAWLKELEAVVGPLSEREWEVHEDASHRNINIDNFNTGERLVLEGMSPRDMEMAIWIAERLNAKTNGEPTALTHEFDAEGSHRLVNAKGVATKWTHYTQICLLDGMVGHTAYYGVKEDIVTPEEFVKLIATT